MSYDWRAPDRARDLISDMEDEINRLGEELTESNCETDKHLVRIEELERESDELRAEVRLLEKQNAILEQRAEDNLEHTE